MCGHAESMVNTDVFIRFHFFSFSAILWVPGMVWDLILEDFGRHLATHWHHWGTLVWRWFLSDFQERPGSSGELKVEGLRWFGGP